MGTRKPRPVLTMLYVTLGAWALWESFGPSGGLYTVTYYAVPAFTFLRAPSRFGVIVTLVLCVLASATISRWLKYARAPVVLGLALTGCAIVARVAPIPLTPNPEIPLVYHKLAKEPEGAVVEFPLYSRRRISTGPGPCSRRPCTGSRSSTPTAMSSRRCSRRIAMRSASSPLGKPSRS